MGGKQDSKGRRLSKPQTSNTSSLSLATFSNHDIEASSPFSSSDMEYFGDITAVTPQRRRRSQRKSRSKIRDYLYGSNVESPSALSSDEEPTSSSKRLSGAASGAKRRLSRTRSALLPLSDAISSASRLSTSPYHTSPLTHDTEEAIRIAEKIKEKAHTDSLTAYHHVSSPTDEGKHVDSMFAPIRRKSLYTPGIATRSASDILRKPPPQNPQHLLSEADRNYYYNPSHSETSPLARLAALSVSRDGTSSPCSLNIPHLGGLQLGTLRVTNGAASPAPTEQQMVYYSSPLASSNLHDEFITASERSDDEGKMTPKSPLRPLSIMANPPMTNEYSLHPQEDHWTKQGDSSVEDDLKTSGNSLAMAEAYIAELGGNPFSSLAFARHPDDEAIVAHGLDWSKMVGSYKHTSDSLSDSCSATDTTTKLDSGYGSYESLELNHYSNLNFGKAQLRHQVSDPRTCRTVLSSYAGNDAPLESPCTSQISSNTMYDKNGDGAEPNNNSTKTLGTIKTFIDSSPSPSPSTKRKLRKLRSKSHPPPLHPNVGTNVDELIESNIPRVPSLMAIKHAERIANFPLLEHTFPSSGHVTARESPGPPEDMSIPIRFPSPAGVLETANTGLSIKHMLHDFAKSPIKRESSLAINVTMDERSDEPDTEGIIQSPSWSNFGHSKKKKEHKKLVKRAEELRRRLEKEKKDSARQLKQRKKPLEKQARNGKPKETPLCSRNSSQSCSKSSGSPMSQQEANAIIADFGTVAASLGDSPYDIVNAFHSNAGNIPSGSHPHQLNFAMQRPRSAVGMDNMADIDAPRSQSRTRSQSLGRRQPTLPDTSEDILTIESRPQAMFHDVARRPALSAIDIRVHGLEWAKNGQHSRAYSEESVPLSGSQLTQPKTFRDHKEIPGKTLRPYSTILGVPPVPALPPLLGVKQEEAKLFHLRGGSIVIDASSDTSNIEEATRHTRAPQSSPGAAMQRKMAESQPDESAIGNSTQSSDKDSVWEGQRQAWSQRRKSAGEALMKQQRNCELLTNPPPSVDLSPSPTPSATLQSSGSAHQDGESNRPQLPNPSERRAILTRSPTPHHISRKSVGSGPSSSNSTLNSNTIRRPGRFEGGLQYGYEPGAGLGGSAGTRGVHTGASRKSLVVSQEFGVDLSDVPVFVATTSK